MNNMDFLLVLFKIFVVIAALCCIPLILMFAVLGVVFFAVHFTVGELYKIFTGSPPSYDNY